MQGAILLTDKNMSEAGPEPGSRAGSRRGSRPPTVQRSMTGTPSQQPEDGPPQSGM